MFKIFECEKKTHLSPKPLFFSGLKTDLYFENRNMNKYFIIVFPNTI